MHNEKELKWYERRGLTSPSSTSHGVSGDDVGSRLVALKARSWRLEGNMLIAETDWGNVVNFIPTDYILTGTDDNNLPILKKLEYNSNRSADRL